MSVPDFLMEAPAAARYHRHAIEQIVNSVEEGINCALLGPRLSGKTLLLRYIEDNMASLLGWKCAYIDLLSINTTSQQAFFADLIHQTRMQFHKKTGFDVTEPDDDMASSAIFRAFLADYLNASGSDLVLIFDPLEALPTDLVQALLTSLRAAYMDQQAMDKRVIAIVSGALNLAGLTVGESSPFRGIANRVFVSHLTPEQSRELIHEYLAKLGVNWTKPAFDRLNLATSGDIFLIHRISQRCAKIAHSRPDNKLRAQNVNDVVDRFLRDEVVQYAPLVVAVRIIEENPDLLHCILRLMEQEIVPRSQLPLPLSPDLDPLYLTGVVERTDGNSYRLSNLIYRRFLQKHFSPARVGHVLAMAGLWDSAIDYLEASIQQGNKGSQSDLVPAIVNAIYAAEDLDKAVHFLRRGLKAGFGVQEANIWFYMPQSKYLYLIGSPETKILIDSGESTQIPIAEDRLETRAFRQQIPLRSHENLGKIQRAIPLAMPGSKPIGVVTITGGLANERFVDPREVDFQLLGFLNQAARALYTVSMRRQELIFAGRVQGSLLPETLPEIPNWQIAATWKPAHETSGDFYDFITLPGGRLGIVIADVVDKGMGAALLMTMSRTLIRSYAGMYTDLPGYLLAKVNRRIITDLNAGLFVTLFYGVLNVNTGKLTYCNAGHPPPFLLIGSEQNRVEELQSPGMPVGISEESEWVSTSITIPNGSWLLLYTDGVIEAQNQIGEHFGRERILEIMGEQKWTTPQELQDKLISAVYEFSGDKAQLDDITLMVLCRDIPQDVSTI
jgi:hypothetical protein